MGLKYPVKVNRVTNLSDARYCAGMGVDVIGLSSEVALNEVTAIMGWITGVDLCIDASGTVEEIKEYLDHVKPAFVETEDLGIIAELRKRGLSCIFRIEGGSYEQISQKCDELENFVHLFNLHRPQVSFEELRELGKSYKLIVDIDSYTTMEIEQVCENIKPAMLSMSGGQEIAPGLKNFDKMAEILEYLETSD